MGWMTLNHNILSVGLYCVILKLPKPWNEREPSVRHFRQRPCLVNPAIRANDSSGGLESLAGRIEECNGDDPGGGDHSRQH